MSFTDGLADFFFPSAQAPVWESTLFISDIIAIYRTLSTWLRWPCKHKLYYPTLLIVSMSGECWRQQKLTNKGVFFKGGKGNMRKNEKHITWWVKKHFTISAKRRSWFLPDQVVIAYQHQVLQYWEEIGLCAAVLHCALHNTEHIPHISTESQGLAQSFKIKN